MKNQKQTQSLRALAKPSLRALVKPSLRALVKQSNNFSLFIFFNHRELIASFALAMTGYKVSNLFLASCFLFLFIFNFSFSQNILWEKSYGGDKVDYLFDAIPTKDYGFLLAGSSLSSAKGDVAQENQGNYDYWVWKMNEEGNLVWQKSFGGDSHDLLKSIKHTHDGGFILAGTSNSNKSGQKKKIRLG